MSRFLASRKVELKLCCLCTHVKAHLLYLLVAGSRSFSSSLLLNPPCLGTHGTIWIPFGGIENCWDLHLQWFHTLDIFNVVFQDLLTTFWSVQDFYLFLKTDAGSKIWNYRQSRLKSHRYSLILSQIIDWCGWVVY